MIIVIPQEGSLILFQGTRSAQAFSGPHVLDVTCRLLFITERLSGSHAAENVTQNQRSRYCGAGLLHRAVVTGSVLAAE